MQTFNYLFQEYVLFYILLLRKTRWKRDVGTKYDLATARDTGQQAIYTV